MKKKLTLVVSLLLVMALSIGGTLAFLTAQTDAVTNTFTVGNITITLAETKGNSFKIVPGATVEKDPLITVKSGSEKCYVYALVDNTVVIDETVVATPDINTTDWVQVGTSGTKTLYRYKAIVNAASADQPLKVFEHVTFNGTAITATNITDLADTTITIDAFAHQAENIGEGTTTADTAAKNHFGI